MRTIPIFVLISLIICLPAHAEQSLVDALGESVSVIQKNNITKIAVLNVIEAETAEQNALKQKETIAGYPIAKPLPLINHEKSETLVSLLLDQNNYNNRRKRCVNSAFYGIRFSHNSNIVEFALGTPCNQILAVFNQKQSTQRLGSVMTKQATHKIINLLSCDKVQ